MFDVDLEEIIRAMLYKSNDITYYLNKDTGDIVHVDENIALEVEDEYDEADTVKEDWGADLEDDDMYHENIYQANNEELDEKELIKSIRYTNQDNYEPVPTFPFSQTKKFVKIFFDSLKLKYKDEELDAIYSTIENSKTDEEIEKIIKKELGEKENWIVYYQNQLIQKAENWISSLGY